MGIYRVYDEVKTIVRAAVPSCEFVLTAEALDFHGSPPRVVWELPVPGGEEIGRDQLAPGSSPTRAGLGRLLWARRPTCVLHVWMAATGTTSDGAEYLDDNEDPSLGDVWLVQTVVAALHKTTAGQYELGAGGFAERSMAACGFVYVLPVSFRLGIFENAQPAQVATPTTFPITGGFSS